MNSPAQTVIRVGKSLTIHLVLGALLYGLAIILVSDFDSASATIRDQYQAEDVGLFLQEAKSKFVGWFALSMLISWIGSAAFLFLAQRKASVVRSVSEARRSMPLWIALFVLVMGTVSVLWWREISLADVAQLLLDNNYLILVTSGYVVTALAFWFATGLAVITTLKPAVPAAENMLPNFWN